MNNLAFCLSLLIMFTMSVFVAAAWLHSQPPDDKP